MTHWVRSGNWALKPGEQALELGNHLDQQDAADQDGHADHRHGIDHGLFYPGLEVLAFFPMGGDPFQQGIQGAGLFAGLHQIAVQLVKVARMSAQRCGQAGASLDVAFEAGQQLAHQRLDEALGNDFEGLQQWHSGLHQGCQLPGEQGDLPCLDSLARSEPGPGLAAYPGWSDALPAQLSSDQRRVCSAQLAGQLVALAVGALPEIDAGHRCFYRHGSILDAGVSFLKPSRRAPDA